jgi:ribosomal protein L6P/L9E
MAIPPSFPLILPKNLVFHFFDSSNTVIVTGQLGSLCMEASQPFKLYHFEAQEDIPIEAHETIDIPETNIIDWSCAQDQKLFDKVCDSVQYGHSLDFTLVGTGYKATWNIEDGNPEKVYPEIMVGHSHSWSLFSDDTTWSMDIGDVGTQITLYGIDSEELGALGGDLLGTRKPDPYKAKGVRVSNHKYSVREGKKK